MADTNTTNKKPRMVKFRPEFHPGVLEEDVNISVNGKRYIFPRGKEVEVPEFVHKEYIRSGNAAIRLHKTSEKLQFEDPVAKQNQERTQTVLIS